MPPDPRTYDWAVYWRGFRAGAAFVMIVMSITIAVGYAWMAAYV